jgi:CHASE1-domain containing sensor protein
MAAVLGAALAAVVGTSPLAVMRQHHPATMAIVLGLTGLVFLAITLFLVMQVMRPQSVSYTDIQNAPHRRACSSRR